MLLLFGLIGAASAQTQDPLGCEYKAFTVRCWLSGNKLAFHQVTMNNFFGTSATANGYNLITEGKEVTNLVHTGNASGWQYYTFTGSNPFVLDSNRDVVFYLRVDEDGDGYTCDYDCDDTDATVAVLQDWYRDSDGDHYAEKITDCYDRSGDGYVLDINSILGLLSTTEFDCEDTNASVNPDGTEIIGDGLDNDCDAATSDISLVPFNDTADCGQVLSFDGVDDYILTDISLQNRSFTLEAWTKINVTTGTLYFFGGGTASSSNGLHAGYKVGENKLWFSFFGNDLSASVTVDQDWHHVAFTFLYDATQANIVRKIYYDGVEVGSQTDIPAYKSSEPLEIGRGFTADNYSGLLDEVKVWNRMLSQSEVAQSASNMTLADEATALIAHYDFNGLAGSSTLTDLVGNHDGTLTSMDAIRGWYQADGTQVGEVYYTDSDGDDYVGDALVACVNPGAGYYLETELAGLGKMLGDCDDTNFAINSGVTEVIGDGLDNDCDPATSDLPTTPVNDGADCGQVLSFDGINDYVSVPYNAALNASTFSASAWVRVTGGQGLYRAVLSSRWSAPTKGWIIYATDANVFSLFIANSGGTWTVIEGPAIELNTWAHVAATYDGTTATFYVDGVSVGQKTITYVANTSYELRIGAGKNESATPDYYMYGQIDEVQIWNSALSKVEIAASASGLNSGTEPGLVAYYDFNGQFGSSTLADLTGNHNGTLKNMDANTDWIKDDGTASGHTYYADTDADGYVGDATISCSPLGAGYYLASELAAAGKALGDCDDTEASINPDATEIEGNGKDDDCDPTTFDSPANALNFDGTNDYISATGPDLASKSFSIEFWAQRTTTNVYGMVLFMGSSATGKGLNIPIMDNNKVRFSFYGADFDSNSTITDTNWHHYAMTYDYSDGSYSIYIDGVEDRTGTFGITFTGSTAMLIGQQLNNGSRYFKGKLDEFRIWNKALTATEINDSKDCELNGDEAGLLAYYQFNQGEANGHNGTLVNLTDASGNGHTGTLHNFGLTGTTSNWTDGSLISHCNVAPVLSAIGDQSVAMGETLTFTASATDEDSPTLTYSLDATSESAGMSIDASTGAFSWTPTSGQSGSHSVTVTVSDGEDTDSEMIVVTVSKEAQTITFDPLAEKTFGDASFDLTATASSSLGVSYASSDETVATISGSTVIIVGAGTTTITASQAGDATYAAAADVAQDLVVNKASQTITMPAIPDVNVLDSTSFTLGVTASSGLPVVLSSSDETVATVAGMTITVIKAGAASIMATQPGDDDYLSAENATDINVFATYVWNGSAWNTGSAPSTTNNALIKGDYTASTHGYIMTKNLEVASGATVTIDGANRLYVEGNLVNNGAIIIESGSSFVSYEALDVTGNPITFRRNTRFTDGRYSFVGSPVKYDATIIGSQLGSHVYRYDESADATTESLNR